MANINRGAAEVCTMVYICHINLEVVYVMLMPTYIQTNIQQESKEQKGVYIKQFILGLY